MFNKLNNLQQRLLMGSVGAILLLTLIYWSHAPFFRYLFVFFIAAVISSALWEYYHIAKSKVCQPLIKIGLIGSTTYVLATFLRTQYHQAIVLPEIIIGITLLASFAYYFIKGSDPFINLAITMFGILYLTIPLSYIIDINYFESSAVRDGRWCLLYLLFVTKMTDVGAFFIGKKFGQKQLSPYISPNKTWEGALGGLCAALSTSIIAYILIHLFTEPPFVITVWQSIWLAVLISIVGQFGDLAESLLKRDVGVKDSSHLPGLGGFLDMLDSLVFTSPLMYIFLSMQKAEAL